MSNYNEIIARAKEEFLQELKLMVQTTMREETEFLKTLVKEEKDEDLLTIAEAMSLLHCTRTTLYNWQKAGKIESYRIGQKVFFKKDNLLKSLKKRGSKSK